MSHFNYALVPGTIFSQLPESFISTFTTIEQNSFQNLIPFQGDQIFHTGYSITDDKFQSELEKVNAFRIIEKLNIRRFSFDVGPCYRKTDTKNARYVGVGEKVSQKEIFELCEQKIDWFRKHVPDTCEIAIENLNYYPTETGAYEEGVCEPEFYNKVCRNFGVNLVLDLGHALVSAWNLNLDKTEYLKRFEEHNILLVTGGPRRQDSVKKGLDSLTKTSFVAIHDAARPCVSKEIIDQGIKVVSEYGSAIPVIPITSTIKLVDESGFILNTLDRNNLFESQTPQFFNYEMIMKIHKSIVDSCTDDAIWLNYQVRISRHLTGILLI